MDDEERRKLLNEIEEKMRPQEEPWTESCGRCRGVEELEGLELLRWMEHVFENDAVYEHLAGQFLVRPQEFLEALRMGSGRWPSCGHAERRRAQHMQFACWMFAEEPQVFWLPQPPWSKRFWEILVKVQYVHGGPIEWVPLPPIQQAVREHFEENSQAGRRRRGR